MIEHCYIFHNAVCKLSATVNRLTNLAIDFSQNKFVQL